jgi:hypothetical protein
MLKKNLAYLVSGDKYDLATYINLLFGLTMFHNGRVHKNGLFYFIINGNFYPGDVRTSTLSSDLYEIIDSDCALISHPQNNAIFSLSTDDAFNRI